MRMKLVLLAGVVLVARLLFPFPDPGPVTVAFAPWIIPAIMALIGVIGSKTQPNKTIYEAGNPLFPGSSPKNQALFDQLVGPKPTGGGGGGGSQTSTNSSSTSNTIQDMIQTPFLTPEYAGMGNTMKNIILGRLQQPGGGLPPGYEASQIGNINTTYDAMRAALANRLSGQGAAGSPGAVGAGEGYLEAGRGRDIATMRGQLPLLSRDLQSQDVGMAAQLAQTFGLGQKQHSTSSTKTNSSGLTISTGGGGGGGIINPGTPVLPDAFYQAHANANQGNDWFSSIAGILGMLYASGVFGGKDKGSSSGKSSSYAAPLYYDPYMEG